MKRMLVLGTFVFFAACATMGSQSSEQQIDKQKIGNITYFDVGTCRIPNIDFPAPLEKEAVVSALVLLRPNVLECFVDPKNRGPSNDTVANVSTTVSPTGVKTDVSGENLTPSGKQCVESVVAQIKFPKLESKATPLVGEYSYHHGGSLPAVKMGLNAVSDAMATIRLSMPNWCSCFAGNATTTPPTLKAALEVETGKPNAVSFEAATSNSPMAMCLAERIKGLDLVANPKIQMTAPLLFVNSMATEQDSSAMPELQIVQLDAIRGRTAASTAMAIAHRNNAVSSYDTLVSQYKKKQDYKLIKPMMQKCEELEKANVGWVAALKQQLEADKRTLALSSKQKEIDAKNWAGTEQATSKIVAETQEDVAKAEKALIGDKAICPKEKK